MSTVYIYGASIDEHGKAHGGQAGNQTGRELRKQKWYKHSKGWRVFRPKDIVVASKIAECARAAVANMHIGYDQYQRNTLYNEAAKYGFDVSKVIKDVECDCSALVRVCCAYAGILGLPEGFRTTNEPKNLLNTGAFVEMEGSKYTDNSQYLCTGDILCTATQGHTVVVGNDGSKAEARIPVSDGLHMGDYGTAVLAMQQALLAWKGDCLPKYGADGDFGSETEKALKAYQKAAGLPVTGVYDETTRNKLTGTEEPVSRSVLITGGTVNVRSAPGLKGAKIGTCKKGDKFEYGGLTADIDGTDWHLIDFKNQNAWVSGKYAKLV